MTTTAQPAYDLLHTALAWHAIGVCIVPAAGDTPGASDSKQPWPDSPVWTPYKAARPTEDQLHRWFGGDRYSGLGAVCGQVSGNLELLEFEGRAIQEGLHKEIADIADASGLGDLWKRITRGYCERSPSGGIHLLYRVDGEPVPGNARLAVRPATDDELTDQERAVLAAKPGKMFTRVLVETRGEGGYVVVAPSNGATHPSGRPWTLLVGGPGTLPTITADEHRALHALCAMVDRRPTTPAPAEPARRDTSEPAGERPGDDFNARASWDDILTPHGWTVVHGHGHYRVWRRPGKDKGVSATTGRNDGDNLWVFSTSTEFEAEKHYSKFAAYTLLEHGGDYRAAAKALQGDGYGGQRRPQPRPASHTTPPSTQDPQAEDEDADPPPAHLAPIPTYPTDAIPGPLSHLIRSGTRAGLPAAYIAAGGLAALTYAALDCRITINDRWTEPATLWIAAIGGAGTAKSPAVRYGWHPIDALETQLRGSWQEQLESWASLPKKERGPQPVNPARLVSDITTEALLRRLAEGPKTVVVDELRAWLGGIGRYGLGGARQKDLGTWLALWQGDTASYDRVGGDVSIVVPRPVVPIIGTLQIEDQQLLGDVRSGFRSRWLPHLGPVTLAGDGDDNHGACADYEAALTRLVYSKPRGELRLAEGDARQAWRDARARWRSEAHGASPGVRAALAKADKQALRIALVIAISLDAAGDIVPLDAINAAVAIVDYAMGCWRAMPEDEALTLDRTEEKLMPAVEDLAAWLERREDRRASRREILLAKPAGLRTAHQLTVLMNKYEAVYPGSIQEERTGARGPAAIVVYAPRRSPETVDVNSLGATHISLAHQRLSKNSRSETYSPERDHEKETAPASAVPTVQQLIDGQETPQVTPPPDPADHPRQQLQTVTAGACESCGWPTDSTAHAENCEVDWP
jgi:hypothetical protein